MWSSRFSGSGSPAYGRSTVNGSPASVSQSPRRRRSSVGSFSMTSAVPTLRGYWEPGGTSPPAPRRGSAPDDRIGPRRSGGGRPAPARLDGEGGLMIAALNRLTDLIEERLTDDLDVTGLAGALGTTEYHLR